MEVLLGFVQHAKDQIPEVGQAEHSPKCKKQKNQKAYSLVPIHSEQTLATKKGCWQMTLAPKLHFFPAPVHTTCCYKVVFISPSFEDLLTIQITTAGEKI